tara:strand:+ start:2510 stop:3838 length:1329 start_codon:yes stop_codon:yes gene_type:complete
MKTIKQLKKQQRLSVVPRRQNRAVASSRTNSRDDDPVQQRDRDGNPVSSAATTNRLNDQVQQLAEQLAQEIIAEQQQTQILARNGRTFTKFDTVNDVIDNQTETVTAGLWSNNVASLTTYFSSSTQTDSQRKYYVDVFNGDPATTGNECQFSIAYGHALGSGSDSQGQLNDSPSKAIYSQYRQLLLNPTDTRFTTAGSGSTDHIYVVNFKRNRLKERLDAGNFELPLASMSASLDSNATGSNVAVTGSGPVFTLIDDSSLNAQGTLGDSGRIYNIVSGSINSGVFNPTAPVYYGLAYPDYGTLILDGKMLDQQLNFQTNSGSSSEGNNHFRLFHSVSGSAGFTNPETADPYGFLARNSEKVTSTHYFVRIKNAEYNFSNNPSFTTGSDGLIQQSTFIGDPKVYITTVGLYSNQQELLAVAKLSKPLLKSFQREALIRVKLDF